MERHLNHLLMGVAAACLAGSPALAQSVPELESGLTATSMTLRLDQAGDGQSHWRIDASSNLVDWVRVDDLTTLDGTGQYATAAAPTGSLWLYRVTADSSVSNVLHLPATPFPYSTIALPPHLTDAAVTNTDNTPAGNPVTDAGATLGRVLFYDKKLSQNHTIACASCHRQADGFSDTNAFSTGFLGGLTDRNSMGLANSKFYQRGSFFWDERAATLEIQTLQPIQHAVEMGMTLTGLVIRLDGYTYYDQLFTAAFGDPTITTVRVAQALSQFMRSMLSFRSKFDVGFGNGFTNFTAQELLGQQLFNGPRGACSTCHGGPNLVGSRLENNGLEFPYVDAGAGAITGLPADQGKFKMSSLRNIERTAPYMHDGRHATLEAVIDHYSTGVVINANLGPTLTQVGTPGQGPAARRPNFTADERAALVAFLKTLTDPVFLADPKYTDPF